MQRLFLSFKFKRALLQAPEVHVITTFTEKFFLHFLYVLGAHSKVVLVSKVAPGQSFHTIENESWRN